MHPFFDNTPDDDNPRPPLPPLDIFWQIRDAVLVLDHEWRIVYANRRACEISQKPVETLLGRTYWEEWPASVGTEVERQYRRAITEQVEVHFEHRCDAPEDMWLEIDAYPSADGGLSVLFRDITDLRDAEAALRESEHLRRAALAGAPMVLWAMDPQGVITLAEGRGLALAGMTPEDYIGRSVFALSESPALRAAWRQALVGEDAAYDTANAGRLFHNELKPQREASGAITGVIGVAFDVTEREAAAAALREAAERQKALLREVLVCVTEGKLLLSSSPAQLPTPLTAVGEPIRLTREAGLFDLRRRAERAAREAAHREERVYDLVTASSEAGMNSVVHGGGGTAWVSAGADGKVQVRVEDQGAGIAVENLPRAALARGFSTGKSLGHGLKMMIETADRLFLMTSPLGTTVVLEQERVAPLPPWL